MLKKAIVLFIIAIFTFTGIGLAEESSLLKINGFNLDKSEVLTKDELGQITAEYQGKTLSFAGLQQIIDKINNIYREKGFMTAKAVLPPQKIKNGIVRIQLMEGRLGKIAISGNEYTRDSFIMDRISLQVGDIFNLNLLEEEINQFNNRNDLILKAKLKPGQNPGEIDMIVNTKEPDNINLALFADNEGREETGVHRYGLAFINNSLRGFRDRFELTALYTKGALAGSISYNVAVSKDGHRLGLSYSKNQSDVISGSFAGIEIKSDYSDTSISLSFPYKIRDKYKSDLSIALHEKNSDTTFSGTGLLGTKIKSIVMAYNNQAIYHKNAINTAYNLTLGSFNTVEREGFYKLTGLFNWKSLYKKLNRLEIAAAVQVADRKILPSAEQFSLGGISTIRGFESGKSSGNRGYLIKLQINRPVNKKVEGFAFIDHGATYSSDSSDQLSSIGLGTSINLNKHLNAKIVYGIPVDSEDEPRLHLTLQSSW